MKHKQLILKALFVSGALVLIPGQGWSAGTTRSEGTGMSSDVTSGQPGSQRYSKDTIKGVQQALKDKGHDPGSIDGIMGQRTQDALRSFQEKEGLKATGRLDDQTAQKLGVSMGSQGGAQGGQRELKPGRNENPSSPTGVEERKDRQKNVE